MQLGGAEETAGISLARAMLREQPGPGLRLGFLKTGSPDPGQLLTFPTPTLYLLKKK